MALAGTRGTWPLTTTPGSPLPGVLGDEKAISCVQFPRQAVDYYASLEAKLIERRSFESKAQAHMAVLTWIEGRYNPRRRHSGLDYLSPLKSERSQQTRFNTPAHDPQHPDVTPQMV